MAEKLREHCITLTDGDLVLRPMTEDDWEILLRWNNDPEVLWFSEGDHVTSRSLDEVQGIYRSVSRNAFVFVAEHGGRPVGECWLQRMNMARILTRWPAGTDLRRIDLVIGEKEMWGKGLGTRMIRLLSRFGFEACGTDAIYGLTDDSNPRSCRAFQKAGYVVEAEVPSGPGAKGALDLDQVLTREAWEEGRPGPARRRKGRSGWAVLLDAGGVILDEAAHERAMADLVVEALAGVVPGYSLEDYRRDVEEAVRNYAPRIARAVLFKRVRGDSAVFERVWSSLMDRWRSERPPLALMPGIRSEIRDLSGDFALALAGQYGHRITDLLEEEGLRDELALCLHQGHFEVTKPDPRFLEQIAHMLDVEPSRCVVVGDRIDKDVVPARQLGMKAILVRVGLHRHQRPRLPEEVPDAELDGVTGLAKAVRAVVGG
jgi:FMN phosphatase YigB (HAD superfamily)/RimJ/RimL family protein N-acetyltransferase